MLPPVSPNRWTPILPKALSHPHPKTLGIGVGLGAILAIALPLEPTTLAQEPSRLISGCQADQCWTDKLLKRDRLSQMPDATFYKLSLSTDWTKPKPLNAKRHQWVYCSQTRPSVAVELPKDLDIEQAVTVYRFNPGRNPSPDQAPLYQIYWGICHDRWSAQPLDYPSLGRQWGYGADLPTSEKRIPRGLWKF